MRFRGWGALAVFAATAGCGTGSGAGDGPPSGGGSGGTGGVATGGSGGTGGNAGTGGTGGGGAITQCPPNPSFVDEGLIARATVAVNSCYSDDGFWRTQNYLRGKLGGYQYLAQGFVECLASVTNGCAGVLACHGYAPLAGGETCGTCLGNVAVSCHADGNFLVDCTKLGGKCASGKCDVPDHPPCETVGFQESCDAAGRPVTCDDYLIPGPVCADFGLKCVADHLDFGTGCQGTGTACSSTDDYFDIGYAGVSCNGAVLDVCVRGKRASLDCSCFGQGFSCQTAAGVSFCGVAGECNPIEHQKTCSGSSVVYCNAGKLVTVDCVGLGFTKGCASSAKMGCVPP